MIEFSVTEYSLKLIRTCPVPFRQITNKIPSKINGCSIEIFLGLLLSDIINSSITYRCVVGILSNVKWFNFFVMRAYFICANIQH
ncbi:hypothetical protein SDC9_125039 [bioreactor metagenome]|uniref:Uncharacterized protein n=1 Tax=bioreactor metagenome TaxID=1076179 RepID=A0A645CMB5_9ZZZZ